MNSPLCSQHNTPLTWKEGTSKTTGRGYAFWACSTKNADGTWCKAKNTQAPIASSEQAFAAKLDSSAKQMDTQTKDKTITRIAIAKSLIEAGHPWGLEAAQEAEAWLSWVEGRSDHVKPVNRNVEPQEPDWNLV